MEHYKEIDPTHYIYKIFYHWGRTDYIQTEQKLMSEDMQKEVNNQMLDEEDFDEEWPRGCSFFVSTLEAIYPVYAQKNVIFPTCV